MITQTPVTFTARQYDDGTPFIEIGMLDADGAVQTSGRLLTFELKPGLTFGEARLVAADLRARIAALTVSERPA